MCHVLHQAVVFGPRKHPLRTQVPGMVALSLWAAILIPLAAAPCVQQVGGMRAAVRVVQLRPEAALLALAAPCSATPI